MKPNIFALAQAKKTAHAKAEQLLMAAQNANRDLTAEESASYEKYTLQMKTMDVQIAEKEADRERERGMVALPDENAMFARAAGVHNLNAGGFDSSRGAGFDSSRGFNSKKGPKYRDLFGPNLSTGGFRDANDFYRALHFSDRLADPRLLAASQTEDVPSAGGFAVPTEFASQIIDRALEQEIVRPRAANFSLRNETLKIPGFDGFNHSSTLYGGFSASYETELAPLTPQASKMYQIQLTLHALKILGQVSNELLQDSMTGYESAYTASLIAAVAFFNDYAYLRGTGAGQPKGVLNDPALITVTHDNDDSGATISFSDVANMLSHLHPASFANSVWVVNPTVIPVLLALTLIGLDTLRAPAVTQGADGTLRLFTREVLVSEKLPVLGTSGDILLADFSQYFIGMKQGLGVERSSAAGFVTDSCYYRIVSRSDGQGSWKSYVTAKDTSTKLSWCVVLDTRS